MRRYWFIFISFEKISQHFLWWGIMVCILPSKDSIIVTKLWGKKNMHLITTLYLKLGNCQQNKSLNTMQLNTDIFHYSVVKADQQPDKMLKCYSEQCVLHLNEYCFVKKMSDITFRASEFFLYTQCVKTSSNLEFIIYSNITSFFQFVNKRASYSFGIIS